MRKFILLPALVFVLMQTSAQEKRKVNTYLTGQYTATLYDIIRDNNPWGFGLGLQTFVNTKSKFKVTLDITGDLYAMDDKVYRTRPNGEGFERINYVLNIFPGVSFHPTKNFFVSLSGGPSFIYYNDPSLYVGIKPSLGLFSTNRKWIWKLSYINIFNRDAPTGSDFGSVSFSMGIRLF